MTAVEKAAAAAVAAATDRLAERLDEALSGAAIERDAGTITVAGRGLRHRRLTDPALRWPAGLLQ